MTCRRRSLREVFPHVDINYKSDFNINIGCYSMTLYAKVGLKGSGGFVWVFVT